MCDIFSNISYLGTIVKNNNLYINKSIRQKILKNLILENLHIFTKCIWSSKGFDFLFQEYHKLPWFTQEYSLVFGSNIPDDYFPYDSKNIIVTGYLSQEELSALHSDAWLFIFPSMKVLEYLLLRLGGMTNRVLYLEIHH